MGVEDNEENPENVQPEKTEVIQDENNESSSDSAFEQLSSSSSKVQMFKDIMSNKASLPEEPAEKVYYQVEKNNEKLPTSKHGSQKQVFIKVEPEDFMASITRTNLVRGSTPISDSEKPKANETTKKTNSKKNGRMGALISVESLIDDNGEK